MISSAFLPIGLGLFGLFAAFLVFLNIKSAPAGEGKLKEIADAIHLGAMVFMNAEYKRLAIFCVICIRLQWHIERKYLYYRHYCSGMFSNSSICKVYEYGV